KSPSPTYWDCLNQHGYYFLLRWQWYEWLGIIGPIALLWWFGWIARARNFPNLALLSYCAAIFDLIFFVAALIVTIPHVFALLAVYQPLRELQLVYVFLLLFAGGLLGEFFLKKRLLLWAASLRRSARECFLRNCSYFRQTATLNGPAQTQETRGFRHSPGYGKILQPMQSSPSTPNS